MNNVEEIKRLDFYDKALHISDEREIAYSELFQFLPNECIADFLGYMSSDIRKDINDRKSLEKEESKVSVDVEMPEQIRKSQSAVYMDLDVDISEFQKLSPTGKDHVNTNTCAQEQNKYFTNNDDDNAGDGECEYVYEQCLSPMIYRYDEETASLTDSKDITSMNMNDSIIDFGNGNGIGIGNESNTYSDTDCDISEITAKIKQTLTIMNVVNANANIVEQVDNSNNSSTDSAILIPRLINSKEQETLTKKLQTHLHIVPALQFTNKSTKKKNMNMISAKQYNSFNSETEYDNEYKSIFENESSETESDSRLRQWINCKKGTTSIIICSGLTYKFTIKQILKYTLNIFKRDDADVNVNANAIVNANIAKRYKNTNANTNTNTNTNRNKGGVLIVCNKTTIDYWIELIRNQTIPIAIRLLCYTDSLTKRKKNMSYDLLSLYCHDVVITTFDILKAAEVSINADMNINFNVNDKNCSNDDDDDGDGEWMQMKVPNTNINNNHKSYFSTTTSQTQSQAQTQAQAQQSYLHTLEWNHVIYDHDDNKTVRCSNLKGKAIKKLKVLNNNISIINEKYNHSLDGIHSMKPLDYTNIFLKSLFQMTHKSKSPYYDDGESDIDVDVDSDACVETLTTSIYDNRLGS
jgi:hypothetical protein